MGHRPWSFDGSSKTQGIVQRLRGRLNDRRGERGGLLTERGVAREFSVARMTARQALRQLVDSGHLRVDPSRGYRPADPTQAAGTAPRIALVRAGGDRAYPRSRQLRHMWGAIQEAMVQAGGTVTAIGEPEPGRGRLTARLGELRADGAILDLDCPADAAAEIVNGLDLPCVLINTPVEGVHADVLVQDNSTGGYLAARHLLERGHEHICWLGWPTRSPHGRERFAGFLAALTERGLAFDPRCAAFVDERDPQGVDEGIDRLLRRRPTAIVALWAAMAARVAIRTGPSSRSAAVGAPAPRAGRETDNGPDSSGLRRAQSSRGGRLDPDRISLITWGAVEGFPERWQAYCGGPEPLPDAIHWRMKDMADAALSRLAERIRNPLSPPVKLFLPVRLACRDSCRDMGILPMTDGPQGRATGVVGPQTSAATELAGKSRESP